MERIVLTYPGTVLHEQSMSSRSRHESRVHTIAKVDVESTCLFANGESMCSSKKHQGEDATNTVVLTVEISSIDEKRPRAFDRPTGKEDANMQIYPLDVIEQIDFSLEWSCIHFYQHSNINRTVEIVYPLRNTVIAFLIDTLA
ncbi:hypothetical protein Fot_06705 [Forsythia ovata]|uniref:Uncharacterized protein n=1 Tax=Forsythia ovata TaxID=205694 RepID=A0ABD1WU25_9LAMI